MIVMVVVAVVGGRRKGQTVMMTVLDNVTSGHDSSQWQYQQWKCRSNSGDRIQRVVAAAPGPQTSACRSHSLLYRCRGLGVCFAVPSPHTVCPAGAHS